MSTAANRSSGNRHLGYGIDVVCPGQTSFDEVAYEMAASCGLSSPLLGLVLWQ